MGLEHLQMPDLKQAASIVTCTVENILEPDDIQAFVSSLIEGPAATKEVEDPTNLKRVRERHHSLARLIAGGITQRLAASICNYTEAYTNVLLNNPAMQELVQMYRSKMGFATEVITERLRSVGTMATEEIADRLMDPEKAGKMNTFELAAVAKLGYDRSGHGPASSHHLVSEQHLFDHAEIKRLDNEARRGSREYIIDIQDVRKAALPAPKADDDASA